MTDNEWDKLLKIKTTGRDEVAFFDEIDVSECFGGKDKRERIMIFEIV